MLHRGTELNEDRKIASAREHILQIQEDRLVVSMNITDSGRLVVSMDETDIIWKHWVVPLRRCGVMLGGQSSMPYLDQPLLNFTRRSVNA